MTPTPTTQLDRIDELNRRRAEANERQAARDAEQERMRRADPDAIVPVPTFVEAVGAEPAAVWPSTDTRVHLGSGLRAGGTSLDRVLWALRFATEADRPMLIALWSNGAQQWFSRAAKLSARDTSTIALTLTVMPDGRVRLFADALSAAQILARMDARCELLGPLTADVRGDPEKLAVYAQGPAPAAIPRPLTDAQFMLARLGQAVSRG